MQEPLRRLDSPPNCTPPWTPCGGSATRARPTRKNRPAILPMNPSIHFFSRVTFALIFLGLALPPATAQSAARPEKTLGMYVHQHWAYNHPYAARVLDIPTVHCCNPIISREVISTRWPGLMSFRSNPFPLLQIISINAFQKAILPDLFASTATSAQKTATSVISSLSTIIDWTLLGAAPPAPHPTNLFILPNQQAHCTELDGHNSNRQKSTSISD